MKKLFFEILLLFISFFAVVFFLEFRYRNYFSPVDYVFARYDLQKDSVNTIYIGNSHMAAIKDIPLTDSCIVYNMSIGGQDLFHMMIILEKIIPENSNIRTIVLALDYELIGYDFVVANQIWKDRLYFDYTGKLYKNDFINRTLARSCFFKSNRDLSLLFNRLKPITNNAIMQASDINFIPQATTASEKECRDRAKEHSITKFNEELVYSNLDYLKLIMNLCDEHNVKLMITNLPKKQCYIEHYHQNPVVLFNKKFLPVIKSSRAIYVDLFSNLVLNDSLFVDADHLNHEGSKVVIDELFKAL